MNQALPDRDTADQARRAERQRCALLARQHAGYWREMAKVNPPFARMSDACASACEEVAEDIEDAAP